jgi:ribonuclease BN (tRNA processing enzyme)
MNLQFIGTASALSEPERFHSSFLLNDNENIALFDCGEGTSAALVKMKVSVRKINTIIISHFHPDHIAGLPLLITQMKIFGREEKLTIFVHNSLVETLITMLRIFYHFPDKLKFELEIISYNFNEAFSLSGNINILPRRNNHLRRKYPEEKSENISFVSSGFLIYDKRKSIYYTADISTYEELNLFEDKSPNILITEAAHISIDDIIRNYHFAKYEQVFVTHYSYDLKETIADEIKNARLEDNIVLAVEGMEITF